MLGIPEVIVPPYPGITSAMGLLTTYIKYDRSHRLSWSAPMWTSSGSIGDLAAMRAGLEEQFRADGFDLGQD